MSSQRTLDANDYIGNRYGHLVVIGEGTQEYRKPFKVKCRCDCGSIKDYSLRNLLNKQAPTRSCGCMRNVHEGVKARCKEALYRTYGNMKARCNNPNLPNYYNYGGRGISVCEEWQNSYASFRSWALANGYDKGLTLDRIDNNGNYEPTNCRWVDMKIQSNNKRTNVRLTYNGETHTIMEWSEITGLHYNTIQDRKNKGYSIEEILKTKP